MEPPPAAMSARSRLSGPVVPAARRRRPCSPVLLRVRTAAKTRPRVPWTLPGGLGSPAPPTPSPRPRDKPCLVSPSASRVFGGLGLRLFSRAESQAQLLLTAGSASLFPEPSPSVGIQALSSVPWRARVSPEGAADHGCFGPGTPTFDPAAAAAAASAPCNFCLRSTPGLEPCQPR